MQDPKSASDDAFSRVKEFTRPRHVLLEQRLDLMREELSIHEYRDLLWLMLNFYAPAEDQLVRELSPQLQSELNLTERLKASKLKKDLEFLTPDEHSPIAAKLPTSLPFVLTGQPALLGLMYVMEGATLGGQVISKHLKKLLPPDAHGGVGFYTSYGADLGPMWKAFQSVVREHVKSPADIEQFCAAADQTFQAFLDTTRTWSAIRPA